MSQLNLFTPPRPTVEPRPSNPDFVRKHLHRLLRLARAAERMPWSSPETEKWRTLFPQLADTLPPEEARELNAAFEAELARLDG
jgi:hypothetical protein